MPLSFIQYTKFGVLMLLSNQKLHRFYTSVILSIQITSANHYLNSKH